MSDLPNAFFGTPDKAPPADWMKDTAGIGEDDDLQAETDSAVVKILGFDPATETGFDETDYQPE